jgi:hypothetical protein
MNTRMTAWTIEAKILPLVGLSGHLYLEIFDEAGQRVAQINGLATDPATQRPRSVGLPTDHLRAYVSAHALLADTPGSTRDRHPHRGHVLFQGPKADILKAIETAEKAAGRINKLNLAYLVLTQNSNSVFMHMVDAIAEIVPIEFQTLEAVRRLKPILPGINKEILGRGSYQSLKQRFNQESAKKPQGFNKRIPPPPQP